MSDRQWLSDDDAADLFTFATQASDHEADGYTALRARMKRLAELGVVQHHGFGRYSVTSFGKYVLDDHFDEARPLPLRTTEEINRAQAQKEQPCD